MSAHFVHRGTRRTVSVMAFKGGVGCWREKGIGKNMQQGRRGKKGKEKPIDQDLLS